ncbi:MULTISPECIES: hypothetical protein [unclassified Pseudoalteromonas]|jgi:hypothetical protein|uniref:hypothetical protein n=1 Tax=unclassified Pseudoalteromonas TaxID=194690 RepID=UPI002358B17A|nr:MULTISPECIES: hypothetical protein [unclassified Pseudoalteromonas]MDC9500533.1 hypothetical protein [Pseudoalteromonas sp. Angola-18]MDC9529935.1 hypothetical protein [Pseudoalteromonas sp. Angola-7]
MDIMIPFLGKISRLELEPKSTFHIAGVQNMPQAQKIKLENEKKQTLNKKRLAQAQGKKCASAANEKAITVDDEGNKHLDTWA